MALLKCKASTLLETLMALILLLLIFFSVTSLLHRYYFIGISIEKEQLRNLKQAELYFDFFSSKPKDSLQTLTKDEN